MTKEEELKQEARRLYIDWERRYCKESIPDLLVMFAEPREKRIAELEKENAELKEELNYAESHCLFHSDCPTQKENESLENVKNIYIGDLLKAKEHIENLLYYVKQCTCERSNYAEIEKDIKEAEQFLQEIK